MGDEEWDDDSSAIPVQNVQHGRVFGGRGRGFAPQNGFPDEQKPGQRYNSGFNNYNDNENGESRSFNESSGGSRGHRGGNFNSNLSSRRHKDGSGDNFEENENKREGSFRQRRNHDGSGDDDKQLEKKKEIYIPPEPTENVDELFGSGITSGINFNKYDKIDVKVSGENVPKSITSFESAGLRKLVLSNISKSSYTKPTPVQKSAIPIIMAGRDLMACAQTGSGKTAAFLIPIVNILLEKPTDLIVTPEHCEPQVIIVSPVRELTIQIFEEARKFAYGSSLKVCLVYGGTQTFHQSKRVLAGCHILVATPGRLMDFVNRGKIKFSSVRFVVLDEADRMLDMGFLEEMRKMLENISMVPKGERQTLMFSATFPEAIQRLAGDFLHDYLFLAVGIVGGACSDVEQKFYSVSKFDKRNKLVELLNEHGSDKTLVFVELKRTADIIAAYLSEKDFPTTSIHGDRLQREREEALSSFKSGRMGVLVATAVAARGLDIKNVAHVINYDLPKSIDEYVHRIGRTGRVGNKGLASSFYDSQQDALIAADLIKILAQAEQNIPDFLENSASSGGGGFPSCVRSAFGGRDVRRSHGGGGASAETNSAYSNFTAQPDVVEEEEW